MDKAFWRQRWESGAIGWHQDEHHLYLRKYWPSLQAKGPVFVPLCGKSLDMVWLRSQGHKVVGVELSPIAAREFFNDLGLTPESKKSGAFEVFSAGGYTIYVGDFFALTAEHLKACQSVYDRAALIALPPKMQADYTAHLRDILPKPSQILLITLTYDSPDISGPPFSTPPEQVERLYADWCQIDNIRTSSPQDFRGEKAREHLFKLTMK